MATLKTILKQQAALPLEVEGKLPKGAPSVSSMLVKVADGLPVDPKIPFSVPDRPPTVVSDIIKGIEDVIPNGVTKTVNNGTAALRGSGGYRGGGSGGAARVIGGGYRSM